MDYIENDAIIEARMKEYDRENDFAVKHELMVTVTLHEYRNLVARAAREEGRSSLLSMKLNEAEKENKALNASVETLTEYNEGLNESVRKLREEIAALKGESSNE